jgi:hypothetical protein
MTENRVKSLRPPRAGGSLAPSATPLASYCIETRAAHADYEASGVPPEIRTGGGTDAAGRLLTNPAKRSPQSPGSPQTDPPARDPSLHEAPRRGESL